MIIVLKNRRGKKYLRCCLLLFCRLEHDYPALLSVRRPKKHKAEADERAKAVPFSVFNHEGVLRGTARCANGALLQVSWRWAPFAGLILLSAATTRQIWGWWMVSCSCTAHCCNAGEILSYDSGKTRFDNGTEEARQQALAVSAAREATTNALDGSRASPVGIRRDMSYDMRPRGRIRSGCDDVFLPVFTPRILCGRPATRGGGPAVLSRTGGREPSPRRRKMTLPL